MPDIFVGKVKIDNPLVMAPMAGISDLPFRLMVKSFGAGLVYSEMISSNGLVRGGAKTMELLRTCGEEKPLSMQIFGKDPEIMADAAQIVSEYGADIVDINFGCSVKKVVRNGYGAALMKEPGLAEKCSLRFEKISTPLTIKIRSGWEPSGEEAADIAAIAEHCGVNAIAVHPRTAKQAFAGKSDWSIIRRIKNQVKIPVIGNGDVTQAVHVKQMQEETGCDMVMIGRAAMGAPWIFAQAQSLLTGSPAPVVDFFARKNFMENYIEKMIGHYGEKRACLMLRSRLMWFVKGLPMASCFRESVKNISSGSEALDRINHYFNVLWDREKNFNE